ncbi:AAA domain-containing protein [Lentzea sp. DG1S-22]|uniref:AAA domain-containing protein n=1 Tax=Lentzea sp. DG1S-22 TaxID=3108822 RepID=UPI002E76517A|nr:AAA domain-containing protein [Lentzea sp. DG1S-22]WVH84370.1 AAA domain-containing protein [Lentzea sp. DG1S-22]
MAIGADRARIDLVKTKAESWADDLIDFGPNNTLLYYRDSKTWSLDLAKAAPEFTAQLLSGRKTRLDTLVASGEAHAAACQRARNLRRRMLTFQEEQGVDDVGKLAHGLFLLQPTSTKGTTPVKPLRAPLVLQPLTITPRTAAETDYVLELVGAPEVNPVLLYALNRQHGIDLDVEQLTDELNAMIEENDDRSTHAGLVYRALSDLVSEHGRTAEFEERLFASTFSFDKLPMVRELKDCAELLAAHDVIAATAGYEPARRQLRETASGYQPIEPDEVVLRDEFLVLDADSSQQRAVNAVMDGQHVVIQGPPGTGKSQTIANIITAAAARGWRVLFVAEKRAAIEAVTNRLEHVDLGHLVFDLHQQKLDKRQVAQQVSESLDRASKEPPADVNGLHERLTERRDHLLHHDRALHAAIEPWGIKAFSLYDELLALLDRSSNPVRFRGAELRDLHGDTVQRVEDDLMKFINSDGLRFHRGESAWSESEIRTPEQVQNVIVQLDELHAKTWPDAQDRMRRLIGQVGFQRPTDLPGWEQVLELLRHVENTLTLFEKDVFGDELEDYCFATGDRRWRSANPRPLNWWQRYKVRKVAAALRKAGKCNRRTLHADLSAALAQRNRWQEMAAGGGAPQEVIGLAETLEEIAKARDQLAAVAMGAQLTEPDQWSEDEVTAHVGRLHEERNFLFKVPMLNELTDRLVGMGMGRFLDVLVERSADAELARTMFRYSWYSSLLDEYRVRIPHLGQFAGLHHSHIVSEFREFDTSHFQLNAQRVRRRVAERLREARDAHPEQNDVVRAEAKRKRGHMPLRKLVAKAPDVLLAARPCWAMSPIVVSRLLPAQRLFDLVVFDEASQVEPQDSMTSIMRGKQLVVAGDERQLPPSAWFRTALSGGDSDNDEDDEQADTPQVRDFESILACLSAFIPNTRMLEWHYRSQDERLIAFSNKAFYQGKLITFPGCQAVSPLSLHQVDGRVAPGRDGSAEAEVEKVVDLVLAHARANPEDTLGVITMGGNHAKRVELALRRANAAHGELAEFNGRMQGAGRRLFVKSIEQVQGDERDAIIFSLGAAKAINGRLHMTAFGPLNRQGGERRLNVAITRARKRVDIVASFSPLDMPTTGISVGADLLRQYLEFADNGGSLGLVGAQGKQEMNGFERSIHDALVDAGVPVTPQWGVAGYRIDFALGHRDQHGRMVLAVEADGDTYHQLGSARDRDRLRQEHLERLGWRFHRVWASEWFRDRATQTAMIVESWEKAMLDAERDIAPSPATTVPSRKPQQAAVERGPRPGFLSEPRRSKIDDYSDRELVELCLWLLTDRLQVDRDTRIGQAIEEIGFRKRTTKMEQRIGNALVRAQQLVDGQGA